MGKIACCLCVMGGFGGRRIWKSNICGRVKKMCCGEGGDGAIEEVRRTVTEITGSDLS